MIDNSDRIRQAFQNGLGVPPSEKTTVCCSSKCGCEPSPIANIPTVTTQLSVRDRLGSCKVRFGVGRNNYKVKPGIYAVGEPDKYSSVLVSANYKLSFDCLRSNLLGINSWLLVLDTKGVNVWCAAGKGTFGTSELASRVTQTNLSRIVSHKTLILPQLGAPGVSAHEVKKLTGFSVIFGPVRARDIQKFLASNHQAAEEMRTVKFTLFDRLAVIPMELLPAIKKSFALLAIMFLLNLIATNEFGISSLMAVIMAILSGTVITPLLLPFIPGKAFAFKGFLVGLITSLLFAWVLGWLSPIQLTTALGYSLIITSFSSYLAMNFTGTSTYASPSGVAKEMRISIPLLIASTTVGVILVFLHHLFGI